MTLDQLETLAATAADPLQPPFAPNEPGFAAWNNSPSAEAWRQRANDAEKARRALFEHVDATAVLRLLVERREMLSALRFYGAPESWTRTPMDGHVAGWPFPVEADGGLKARAALEAVAPA